MKILWVLLAALAAGGNWLTYTDIVNHYSISYPDNWTKQNAAGAISFLSPLESETDSFSENVNLVLQDLAASPMTLKQCTLLHLVPHGQVGDLVNIGHTGYRFQRNSREVVYVQPAQGTLATTARYSYKILETIHCSVVM